MYQNRYFEQICELKQQKTAQSRAFLLQRSHISAKYLILIQFLTFFSWKWEKTVLTYVYNMQLFFETLIPTTLVYHICECIFKVELWLFDIFWKRYEIHGIHKGFSLFLGAQAKQDPSIFFSSGDMDMRLVFWNH